MCFYQLASNIKFGGCGCVQAVLRTDAHNKPVTKWKPGRCRCGNYLGWWVEGTYEKKGHLCDTHKASAVPHRKRKKEPVRNGGVPEFQARRPDAAALTQNSGGGQGGKKGKSSSCVVM
jgi:hypothetical protein